MSEKKMPKIALGAWSWGLVQLAVIRCLAIIWKRKICSRFLTRPCRMD